MKIVVTSLKFVDIPHTDKKLFFGPPEEEELRRTRKELLNKLLGPGAVIRTKRGEYFLLGDTSPSGGGCDHCPDWRQQDVVAVAPGVVELERPET